MWVWNLIHSAGLDISKEYKQECINTLQKTCYVELLNLYSKNDSIITLSELFNECIKNNYIFPEGTQINANCEYEHAMLLCTPGFHYLRQGDEKIGEGRVKMHSFPSAYTQQNSKNMLCSVPLTYKESLRWLLKQMDEPIADICSKRGEIYSIDDKGCKVHEKIQYLNLKDSIIKLIEFSLNSTGFLLYALTGQYVPRSFSPFKYSKNEKKLIQLTSEALEKNMTKLESKAWFILLTLQEIDDI